MFHVDLELDRLIRESKDRGASDIHFDAVPEGTLVRIRVDGILERLRAIEDPYHHQVINRIKVLSGLDISERRIPQDGRWTWEDGVRSVPMRVSTLPSIHGETLVCRVLGNEGSYKTLAQLGMEEDMIDHVKEILNRPYGLILITGPTGSGKSATLYAMLRMLNLEEENLISLENPVEATIEGAVQVQMNAKAGLTFASGLRAILRQDPDTIMVGEIRDKETAQLAIQAALTGHRVLSTIHTNTAVAVVERLMDMGVEPYLIQSTLIGALAQRLVRVKKGDHYGGRTAIYELLKVPKEGPSWDAPEAFVTHSLYESAQRKVKGGITTWEELKRIGLWTPS